MPSALYLKGGGAHAAWRDKKISAGTPSSLPSPVPYVPPRYWRNLLPDAGQPSSYARRRPTSPPRPSSASGDSSMPCCLSSRRDWIRNLDCLNHKYVLNSKFCDDRILLREWIIECAGNELFLSGIFVVLEIIAGCGDGDVRLWLEFDLTIWKVICLGLVVALRFECRPVLLRLRLTMLWYESNLSLGVDCEYLLRLHVVRVVPYIHFDWPFEIDKYDQFRSFGILWS